jgi:hypothetical protein
MTFKVQITETLEKTVEIEANNEHEALVMADCNYRAAKDGYVLDADNFTNVDFKVVKE